MKGLLDFLVNIASTPAILVALIAIIGLVLQKKGVPDIVKGGVLSLIHI